MPTAVADQICDGDDRQVVHLRERLELLEARHPRLVLSDHLAQDATWREASEPSQVDGGLGVPGALEHAARAVAKREDVTRAVEISRSSRRIDQGLDGRRPVGGRDPSRRAMAVVDADGERSPLRLGVRHDHQRQIELICSLWFEWRADHP